MASKRATTPTPRKSSGLSSRKSSDASCDAEPPSAAGAAPSTGGTTGLTAAQTKAAESKLSKMITRSVFGIAMILFFGGTFWLGHPYLVLLVALIQLGLFRELVNVRYQPAKEKEVPLFRTLQWAMFWTAMYYIYGKVFVRLGLARSAMQQLPGSLAYYAQMTVRFQSFITFSAYVATFVTFVLSLKKDILRYQIGNFVWTVGVLCLTVYQVKGTAILIFTGLFWFLLPCSLVIFNDIAAYFCGQAMGRKFIKAPFLALSPNKTWEGFIGAAILTIIFAWFFSDWISSSDWFVCPQHDLVTYGTLDCDPANHFLVQKISLPFEDLRIFSVEAKPIQFHACMLGGFASIIAPFGGFLASAIKRAYNIKDFDSLIPGHGGFMDRMDCQLLMLLCTYVHYVSFIKETPLDEEQLFALVTALPLKKQAHLIQRLTEAHKAAVGSAV